MKISCIVYMRNFIRLDIRIPKYICLKGPGIGFKQNISKIIITAIALNAEGISNYLLCTVIYLSHKNVMNLLAQAD